MKTTLALIGLALVLQSCDESLPPRVHPDDVDPREYLEESSIAEWGVVYYQRGDTTSRSTAGTVYLAVTNLHDEVLSGPEDIVIDLKYWLKYREADTIRVVGDRDNLINPFNFQGDVFMLDGDILTIYPDSAALFVVVWDHEDARVWDYGNPRYVYDTCQYPPCGQRIVSDPVAMSAQASIRLFERQSIPLYTESLDLTVSYFFVVTSVASIRLEAVGGWVDSNGVTIRWVTSSQQNVYQFAVQKSITSNSGFETIQDGFIPPEGAPLDTVEYVVTESNPEPGTWYYRIALLEYFNPAGAFIVDSRGPIELVVP